jgi:hypothetical protein
VIDKDFAENLIKQETSGGINNLIKYLSSKALLITILLEVSEKMIA